MDRYNHKDIESKWQDAWESEGIYRSSEGKEKDKRYILDMFPYPSGEGLHVGHPRGYIGTDVYSRYSRMRGYSVLHPMGWDAFGLPAENYALKHKVHPSIAVEKNVERYKGQLSMIGMDYDWSREINTTDPAYYKWTQWIFLELFKKGLAYESNEPINWCPSCKTGLANEDLEGGKCERCGSVVEKKPLRQWVLKITDYADKLLEDLDDLEWPEFIKEMQRNWIGKSEGLLFKSPVKDSDMVLETFSAHYETAYADTFLVIAPDHPILGELLKGVEGEQEIRDRIAEINLKKMQNRYDEAEIEGVFTGRYVEDPLGNGDLPVWVASFAIADYGTGIVKCSQYDDRDVAFAKKYGIATKETEAWDRDKIREHLVKEGLAEERTMYKLRDWVFSRQRYWGEPIPLIHCDKCGVVPVPESDLPVELPDVESYEPTGTGESPLASITDWVHVACPKCGGEGHRETNTMPQWAGSSWYYLRYMDPSNDKELVSKTAEKYWNTTDMYVGGVEHATRHLIYARFWHKFLFDIGAVSSKEPFGALKGIGLISGEGGKKMSKRDPGSIINPDDIIAEYGADTFRVYEMFLGPFTEAVNWSSEAIMGPRRFIERVWRLGESVVPSGGGDLSKVLNKTVKSVTEDIEAFKFNTVVSDLMKLVAEFEGVEAINKSDYEVLLKLLAPMAPHVSEEIWRALGNNESIHISEWPSFDESLIGDDVLAMAVQVDGKVRDTIYVAPDTSEETIKETALKSDKVGKWVPGEPAQVIVVPGKIVSIVNKK